MDTDYRINEMPFCVEQSTHNADWIMPCMHYHKAYEILILEKGHCQILINDHLHTANPGDVFLFSPNMLHKNNGGTNHTRTVLYFRYHYLSQYYSENALTPLLSIFSKEKFSLSRQELTLFLSHTSMIKKGQNPYLHIGCILDILSAQQPATIKYNCTSDRILEYINQHYYEINHLSSIAEHFYYTKEHLCRTFKQQTGLTISEYLNGVRIKNACDLLESTSDSITEIGFSCGFNSIMYFSKTFRKIVHISPSEFRNRSR